MKYREVYFILFILVVVTQISCFKSNTTVKKTQTPCTSKNPIFKSLLPEQTGVSFRNDVIPSEGFTIFNYLNIYNGGGIALGDLNNDGLVDIVFTSNQNGPSVYLNKGGLKFEDITEQTGLNLIKGWYTGVTLTDINGDGLLDIYLCRSGPDTSQHSNLLYVNLGNNQFSEQAEKYGIGDNMPTSQAYFFDYDNDGDLDLYLVNHPLTFENIFNPEAYTSPIYYEEGRDRLFERIDDRFVDVAAKAGISPNYSFGLSASISDFNNDGYADIYVANDFFGPDYIYINNGDKTFSDRSVEMIAHTSMFSMGTDAGDLNNDGYTDLMAADMKPNDYMRLMSNMSDFQLGAQNFFNETFFPNQYINNPLLLSNGGNSFSNIGYFTGTARTDWSWTILFADFNNNGWKDIFVSNGTKGDFSDQDFMAVQDDVESNLGYLPDSIAEKMPFIKLRNYLFLNHGGLSFKEASCSSGLEEIVISNAAAYADLDNDGDLDLVINNTDDLALIYQNLSSDKHGKNYLRFKCNAGKNNLLGVGTKVTLYHNGEIQTAEIGNARGFHSCPEQVIHFGLDSIETVDTVSITWYNGKTQWLYNVNANQTLDAHIDQASSSKTLYTKQKWFSQSDLGFSHTHKEDDFIDFRNERLLPFKISTEGPASIIFDFNSDGLDDVFIGGAFNGSSSVVFLQQEDGSFKELDYTFDNMEVLGVVATDLNNDGYIDLFITTGSNEYLPEDRILSPKLYYNQEGNSLRDASSELPYLNMATIAPLIIDVDKDGWKDILCFGRLMPGNYPVNSRSFLLKNNGGIFTDQTDKFFPQLSEIGNVTAAALGDFTGNGVEDILIAAEWEPLMIFEQTDQKFKRRYFQNRIDTLRGWWRSLKIDDINGDGRADILAGNQGHNSNVIASEKFPVALYYNDFDDNGTKETVLTCYINSENGVIYGRNALCEQMPAFRNRFLTYKLYADTPPEEILTASKIEKSVVKTANYFENMLLLSDKNEFIQVPLPNEIQMMPIYDWYVADLNGDSLKDIIAVGGSDADYYNSAPPNAINAIVLAGQENKVNNRFKFIPAGTHGIFNNKMGRNLLMLRNADGQNNLLIINNGASVQSFHLNTLTDKNIVQNIISRK